MDSKRLSIINRLYIFLFVITDVFGVGNYYTSKNLTVESSIILRIYGLILLSAISIFFFCNIQPSKLQYIENSETSLLFFEYIAYWSLALSCFASSICQQNNIREWIQNTREIIIRFTNDELNRLCIGYGISMFAGLFLLITFTIVFYLDSSQTNKTIFSVFSYSTLYGIITAVVLQFVTSVLFLSHLFKDINDELSCILAESREAGEEFNMMDFFTIEYAHLTKRNDFIHTLESSRIRDLSRRYDLCCSLTRELNDCFSPQLLFINGLCFLEITYSVFCFTLSNRNNEVFSVNFIVVWFFTYVSFLFTYTVSSQRLMDEAMKSGSLTHRIINAETRKSMKKSLEIFSLQIYQSDVVITAMGFFSVNSSLLYEMVGGVSSATVLLIQFQKYSFSEAEVTIAPSHNATF